MLALLADLERKGGLKVAIDSILLVVFPGSVGEVPDKMSRWDNKWKLPLLFVQHFPPKDCSVSYEQQVLGSICTKDQNPNIARLKYLSIGDSSPLLRANVGKKY